MEKLSRHERFRAVDSMNTAWAKGELTRVKNPSSGFVSLPRKAWARDRAGFGLRAGGKSGKAAPIDS